MSPQRIEFAVETGSDPEADVWIPIVKKKQAVIDYLSDDNLLGTI